MLGISAIGVYVFAFVGRRFAQRPSFPPADLLKKANMKNRKFIGTLCAIGAAVCYGTNPFGALNLYALGFATNSVLFYRFSLALVLITILQLCRRESFKVSAREFGTLTALGLLFSASSLSLYVAFTRMDAGVASTLLFVYPIMTALLMALLFHERVTARTATAIVLSMAGVALLYWTGNGQTLDSLGVALVMVSALTYAVYIIVMNRSRLSMSSFKINFFVTAYCLLGILVYSLVLGTPIQAVASPRAWFYVAWLAVVPTIFALVLLVRAAKWVGSTPTAVMGALEPLTAVLIGILVFGEAFTPRLAVGIVLILTAVIVIALKKER